MFQLESQGKNITSIKFQQDSIIYTYNRIESE